MIFMWFVNVTVYVVGTVYVSLFVEISLSVLIFG